MKLRCTLALLCCVVAAPALRAQGDARKQDIAFVKNLQQKNGGFLPAPPDPKSNKAPLATLRATSSAIRALKYLGADLPNKEACAKFVADCFDKDSGGFTDLPGKGKPDVFTTAVGLMAAAELGMPAEPYYAAAVKYLGEHVKNFDEVRIAVAGLERIKAKSPQHEKWLMLMEEEGKTKLAPASGRARVVASIAVTALRLGEKLPNPEFVRDTLKKGQRASGGYGKVGADVADLESSYRVMRGLMMLKEVPADAEGLRSFVAKCRDNDGGYATEVGGPPTIGGTYFAAIIMHWLDQAEKGKK
jgi:prenyltransferase beta subunit